MFAIFMLNKRFFCGIFQYLLLFLANIGVFGDNINKLIYTDKFVLFVNIINERNGIQWEWCMRRIYTFCMS